MKLKFIWSVAAFLMALSSVAQKQDDANHQRTLVTTDQQVTIYSEQEVCGTKDVVFLVIENQNNVPVTITWTLWEGGETKTLTVKANETVTGACTNRQPMFILTEEIPAGKSVNDMHPAIKVIVN